MVQTKFDSIQNDFQWVLKVLRTSKNKEHLNCVLKCFELWKIKYVENISTISEKENFNHMKSIFWINFKNKDIGIIDL